MIYSLVLIDMFQATKLTREQFVSWLGRKFDPVPKPFGPASRVPNLLKDEIFVLWHKSENDDPLSVTIAVEERTIENFLAFTSTYISTHAPFTAFYQVISIGFLSKIIEAVNEPKPASWPTELVGIAIAEAAVQMGERGQSIESVSVLACRATLSNAVITALSVGYGDDTVPLVTKNWRRVRDVVGYDSLRLNAELIEEFWMIVSAALRRGRKSTRRTKRTLPIVKFVENYLRDRSLNEGAWKLLTRDIRDVQTANEALAGTRESQVRSFDKFASILVAADHVDLQIRASIAGFLISILAQGSFRYLKMAQALEDELPTTSLWFALFASLNKRGDVLSFGGSLGRHLVRQFQTPYLPLSTPNADIAVDEFEVLARDSHSHTSFRTEFTNSISVELIPGVSGRFRAPRTARVDAEKTTAVASTNFQELKQSLYRANRAIERIEVEQTLAQRDLFQGGDTTVEQSRRGKVNK